MSKKTYTYTPPDDRKYTLQELVGMDCPVYSQWGPWEFDPEVLVLRDEHGYEIDLEEIDSSNELVDWIFHMAGKTLPPEKLYYLIIALRDILGGEDTWKSTQDGRALAKQYAQKLREQG
jgi:hypothetical protein